MRLLTYIELYFGMHSVFLIKGNKNYDESAGSFYYRPCV
jgi:hypothetical protein